MQRINRLFALLLAALMMAGCACAAETDDAAEWIEREYAMLGQAYEDASLSHEIVHESERYLSILFSVATQSGSGLHETFHAITVARDGLYAGQALSLTQVLGLEQEKQQEMTIASQLVYSLIWQIVETDTLGAESDYLEGLSRDQLESALNPETDFYLDADGNVVFFVQSGEIAGEVAGLLTFPFSPAELFSAINE